MQINVTNKLLFTALASSLPAPDQGLWGKAGHVLEIFFFFFFFSALQLLLGRFLGLLGGSGDGGVGVVVF